MNLKAGLQRLPYLQRLLAERDQLAAERDYLAGIVRKYGLPAEAFNHRLHELWGFPAGHYFSPIHSLEELQVYDPVLRRSTASVRRLIPGLSDRRLRQTFNRLSRYFTAFDFPDRPVKGFRYYADNPAFIFTDALILDAFIKHLRPKTIMEIGSGFSSALMMDVNQRDFNNQIKLTFIEPYPETLYSLMSRTDKKRYRVIRQPVQQVGTDLFTGLNQGDILFIDSTHVSKFNSDVNYILFEILPRLNQGVVIHFHDQFPGFEYPFTWLGEGRAWNEQYLLHAFLMYNRAFTILFFNALFGQAHPEAYGRFSSQVKRNPGCSLWLVKKSPSL